MNEDKRKYPRLNISMLIEYGSKEAFLKDYALNISGGDYLLQQPIHFLSEQSCY
jgi:hypothetical protein